MSKQKLERVLQLMINEENDKATDLLHDIFVEKARKIYSKMIKEDEMLERDLGDWEEDFEDDASKKSGINKIDNEIDFEEMHEAEEDEYEDDLGDEMVDGDSDMDDDLDSDMDDDLDSEMDMDDDSDMDMDMDMDMDDELDSGMDQPDAEEAFMNVEDALAELKAAFAELVGEPSEDETSDLDDEYADDEFDYETDETEPKKIGESAVLKKEKVSMTDGSDGKASPVAKVKDSDKLGVPMKNALKSKEDTHSKPSRPKELGVPGPQDHGSKMKPAPRVKKG